MVYVARIECYWEKRKYAGKKIQKIKYEKKYILIRYVNVPLHLRKEKKKNLLEHRYLVVVSGLAWTSELYANAIVKIVVNVAFTYKRRFQTKNDEIKK